MISVQAGRNTHYFCFAPPVQEGLSCIQAKKLELAQAGFFGGARSRVCVLDRLGNPNEARDPLHESGADDLGE